MASGSDGPIAKVWDANTGRALVALNAESMYIESLAWSPDGKLLAASSNETAKIWEADTGQETATLRGHEGIVGKVTW